MEGGTGEHGQTSVTGCNNYKSGFTLIEILVVLVVIGIASSLIFLNFSSVVSISKIKPLSVNLLIIYLRKVLSQAM